MKNILSSFSFLILLILLVLILLKHVYKVTDGEDSREGGSSSSKKAEIFNLFPSSIPLHSNLLSGTSDGMKKKYPITRQLLHTALPLPSGEFNIKKCLLVFDFLRKQYHKINDVSV